MTEEVKGLDLAAWRAKQNAGEKLVLPSGLLVTLKRVGVLDLAAKGSIPATLVPQLNQIMAEGKMTNMSLKDFEGFAEMINTVAGACLLEPEGLQVEELPYDDRVAIFSWANAGGSRLQPFRKPETQPLESTRPSNVVQSKT